VLRRVAIALSAVVGALLLVPLLAGPAYAVGEELRGRLRSGQDPVPGVKITVTTEQGAPVGEATTGADGSWAVKLPRPGTYTVTIDTATFPEGVQLRDPDRTEVRIQVLTGQKKPLLFPMGAETRVEQSRLDRAVQLLAEGIRFGLVIALASVGLSLIYGTTGLVNFAHGELITFGALVAFYFNVVLDIQLITATALTLVVCAAAGWSQDAWFWGVLRRRGSGLIAMMIISIGVSILVRYLFLYIFRGDTRAYTDYAAQPGLPLGPITLAAKDYWSMVVAAIMLVLTALGLQRTRLGKATRAVSDNPALAAASGIDVERVIRLVWTAGAVLAGLAGVLLGLSQQVNFQMGFQILLLVFAAVTLGGLGTAYGALVGSLIVGLFIQMSTLVIPPELKNVGALAVLVIILLVRPQGILGRPERVG
jgi:neutral amino acid transport system permease protein